MQKLEKMLQTLKLRVQTHFLVPLSTFSAGVSCGCDKGAQQQALITQHSNRSHMLLQLDAQQHVYLSTRHFTVLKV